MTGCKQCGEGFAAREARQVFCCTPCHDRWWYERKKKGLAVLSLIEKEKEDRYEGVEGLERFFAQAIGEGR